MEVVDEDVAENVEELVLDVVPGKIGEQPGFGLPFASGRRRCRTRTGSRGSGVSPARTKRYRIATCFLRRGKQVKPCTICTHFGTGHPDPGHGGTPRPESANEAQCEALEEIEQIRRSAQSLHESGRSN